MSHALEVERFISGKRGEIGLGGVVASHKPGTLPFITVSRQTGAGGRELTRELIEQLSADASGDPILQGWRVFDRSMCETVLKNKGLAESMNELLDEEYHSQIEEFLKGLIGYRSLQNTAYPRLAQILRTVATVGRVVIMGYGGSQATRKLQGGIDVRLIAPLSIRAKRMAPELGESVAQTSQIIQQRDAERRRMLKTHYQIDNCDPEHYDAVFNTEHLTPKNIAKLLVMLVKENISLAK